ncbi:MAG: hypothetical protein ACRD94_08140 [Nitrosopumilaceae archaeon]
MKFKATMKVGDEVQEFDENGFIGTNPRSLEQLLTFKAYMGVIIGMIESKDPDARNKRIEFVMEFEDDGFYLVIGRKPKEVTEFGT